MDLQGNDCSIAPSALYFRLRFWQQGWVCVCVCRGGGCILADWVDAAITLWKWQRAILCCCGGVCVCVCVRVCVWAVTAASRGRKRTQTKLHTHTHTHTHTCRRTHTLVPTTVEITAVLSCYAAVAPSSQITHLRTRVWDGDSNTRLGRVGRSRGYCDKIA